MFGKNLFKILLIFAALGQMVYAKPTPDTPAEAAATPKKPLCNFYPGMEKPSHDKVLPPSAKLLMVTLTGLISSSINYSEKAKPIADAILKENELLAHIDNDEVKSFEQKLETFVNDYNDCKDGKALFKLVEMFSGSTSEFYEQEEDQKLSPQGKIILKLLKQYKVEQIEEEFAADIKNLVAKFEETFDEVKDDLEKEEKYGLGEKIIKWHEQFIALKEYDDQVEALYEFFKLFD